MKKQSILVLATMAISISPSCASAAFVSVETFDGTIKDTAT